MKRIENSIKELKRKVNPTFQPKEQKQIGKNPNNTDPIRNFMGESLAHKSDLGLQVQETNFRANKNETGLSKDFENCTLNTKSIQKNNSQASTNNINCNTNQPNGTQPNGLTQNTSNYSKLLTPNLKYNKFEKYEKNHKDSASLKYGSLNNNSKTYGLFLSPRERDNICQISDALLINVKNFNGANYTGASGGYEKSAFRGAGGQNVPVISGSSTVSNLNHYNSNCNSTRENGATNKTSVKAGANPEPKKKSSYRNSTANAANLVTNNNS
jgi:hypothetical protein